MDHQLVLLDSPNPWKLDRRTVERGRKGLARARQALRTAGADITVADQERAA
jgi:hypothetical protein